jgi:hypothetical protein
MNASIQSYHDVPSYLGQISTELEAEMRFYELLDRLDEQLLNALVWTAALNLFERWGQETWVAPLRARRERLAKLCVQGQEQPALLATVLDSALLYSKATCFAELAPQIVGNKRCVLRFDDGTQAMYLGDVWVCSLWTDANG